jgi:hypothetical protein
MELCGHQKGRAIRKDNTSQSMKSIFQTKANAISRSVVVDGTLFTAIVAKKHALPDTTVE